MGDFRASPLISSFIVDMQLGNYSPVTIKDRVEVIERMCRHLGQPDPLAITLDELLEYHRRFHVLAPASVDIYTRHLRGFYRWAAMRGHIDSNPALKLIMPRIVKGRPHPTPPETLRMIFLCTIGDLRIAYALAAFAGLRRSEICVFDVADLDLTNRNEATALVHGKGRKERVVPILPALVDELEDYGLPRAGYVVRRNGKPYPPEMLSADSHAYLHRIGLQTTLHSMRHYFLTHAARLTRDPLFVRDLAGHSSVATTEIYMDTSMWGAHGKLAGMADLSDTVLRTRRREGPSIAATA